MARGAEAKLRRRNRRKEGDAAVVDMFGSSEGEGGEHDFGAAPEGEIPLPPGMKKQVETSEAAAAAEDDSSDEDNNVEASAPVLPKKGKKRKKNKQDDAAVAAAAAAARSAGGGGGGIKTTPLILLIIMTGTTLLPAVIFAGDYISAFLAKNDVMGEIGFRLGIGAVPRKRVLSFYEKHAPEKVAEVPKILSKHYGDYPKLIKKLERKYQDYGYFLGWEADEEPMRLAKDQLQATYDVWIEQYWNRHAPQPLKTAARNVRYNLTFLVKKFRKAWKKHIWPVLEPVFGVPDGGEKQKRKDAAEARKRKGTKSGTRRKNTDYRDDDDS